MADMNHLAQAHNMSEFVDIELGISQPSPHNQWIQARIREGEPHQETTKGKLASRKRKVWAGILVGVFASLVLSVGIWAMVRRNRGDDVNEQIAIGER